MREISHNKLAYKGSWYDRYGVLIVENGIISMPKALSDYRKELGLNSQHIDTWLIISGRYRGSEPPRLEVIWIAEALNRKPDTTRKILRTLINKNLLRKTHVAGYKYKFDLQPSNIVLDGLLSRDKLDNKR